MLEKKKSKKVKFITVLQPNRVNCTTVQNYQLFFIAALKKEFFLGGLLAKISRLIIFFGGLEASPRFEWHKVLCIILVINFLVPATRLHLNGGLIDGPSRNT